MMEETKEPETENFFARRTESVDASGIASLVRRRTENVFGRINVEYIIERANLGISLVGSESGEILAHASLLDYPSVTSVDPARWEHWTQENFTEDIRASPINTLFLHLFVAKEGFQQAAIAETLRIAFVAVPPLQYIIFTASPGASLGPALLAHFSAWSVVEGRNPSHLAYVSHRHQHFPVLHVRTARVEDADDLMPIFRQYAHDMTEDYGEFYLAELIESQDSDHKTFVAEVGGRAVGFLSVTTQVDLGLLTSCFQLEAYHSLRHPALLGQEPSLMSHSVLSIATSDHPQGSSTSIAADATAAEPAADSSTQASSQPEGVASSDSQAKLSSSSLVRLAQIAQMTSSKSRLSQSKSKLATTTHTKTSKAKVTESTTESTTKVTDHESKAKISPPKSKLTESKAKVSPEKIEAVDAPSTSPAKASQSAIAASESGAKAGLSNSNVGQTQSSTRTEREEIALSTSKLMKKSSGEGGGEGEGGEEGESAKKGEGGECWKEGEGERSRRLAGQSSTVAVQLFAIHDQYEMRSVDLLVAVFKAFPDHDFCLLSLPHSIPEIPLLSNFTRVPPRVHCTLPQELYVLHKCSLLHSFMVRSALTSDLSGVKHLVGSLEGGECVMTDVVRSVERGRDGMKEGATPISALVAECADQIVGVAVVRKEEELLFLRSHYNIEDFVFLNHHRPEEHGRLHHLILSPAFSPLGKHFVKEVLRQSHMTSLYYPFHPSLLPPAHPHKPHTITTVLSEMVPVRSRRQVVYPHQEVLGVNQPLPQVLAERKEPFTLYHINRKLSLEPQSVVNSRVVVVGASDTSLSLLEALVFSPHLAFTNLVLVSPAGLPSSSSLPNNCCYWPASHSQMGLTAQVHTVHGSVVAISRESKEVIVWSWGEGEGEGVDVEEGEGEGEGEEGIVPYDYLILCTGLQFTLPPILDQSGEIPLIYDANEGLGVSEWTQKYVQSKDHILLYGCSLEAYSALHSLLASGVAPEQISFIQPHPPTCFNNPTVEQRVQRSLEDIGIVSLAGHTLSSVNEGGVCLVMREEEKEEEELIFVECQAIIYMDDRQVSSQVFAALNDACLVFDQRLVIDACYHTNDPAILAAGPMAKFSRQYYADQWTPANFNSKEVGQELAAILLSKLDPTAQEKDVNSDPLLLPTYTQPKSVFTILPGGLHYLHMEKPNLNERLDCLMSQTNYGQELVTDTENGYFRVHINYYSRVQTVTVLSEQPFETTNYLSLYNLHEKYLNNLASRYEEGLILDFFTYFREPWACAVFHDRFSDLREEIKELLSQPAGGEDVSVEQRVTELLSEQQTVSMEAHKEQLLSDFNSSSVKPSIQQLLHRYLHYNHYHLPMYAHPDIL